MTTLAFTAYANERDRELPHDGDAGEALAATGDATGYPVAPEIIAALERSGEALNAWLAQYAGEFMGGAMAAQAMEPMREYGTIWYIAEVGEQVSKALLLARASAAPIAGE